MSRRRNVLGFDKFKETLSMRVTRMALALVAVALGGAFVRSIAGTTRVVVTPQSMQGWMWIDDQASVPCADASVCAMTTGPWPGSTGGGSAELSVNGTGEGKALLAQLLRGTPLSAFTALQFRSYRTSADANNNLSISLQLNVDYDLGDASNAYQGRLVFEPYLSSPGSVSRGTWHDWDALAGRWWGTRSSVTADNVATTNPCVQSSPCTWAQLLERFPRLGIHATYGAVVFKAGSGWNSFRGSVDELRFAIGTDTTVFDFEPADPTSFACYPSDALSEGLLSWTLHTTRDTGAFAAGERARSGIAYLPAAQVSLVSDSSTCRALAMAYASNTGRAMTKPNKVIAVSIDGFGYVMTNLTGGNRPRPSVRSDGAIVHPGDDHSVDALTTSLSLAPIARWQFVTLNSVRTPY